MSNSGGEFLLAKQFSEVDVIVVGAPYWDMMFPAVVKNYFENVTMSGLTFQYGQNGIPRGLCKAKNLFTLPPQVALLFIILVLITLTQYQNAFTV